MNLSSVKGLIAAIRTNDLSFIFAKIQVIVNASPAKTSFASVALDRLL
jgi:hypothetical protein